MQGRKLEKTYAEVFDAPTVAKTYIHVEGDSYHYYYQPNHDAFKLIESRISSSGRRGQIGAWALKLSLQAPQIAQALPNVTLVSLQVPETVPFDGAICGRRMKTFHLSEGLVYTFLNDESLDLLSEVRIRQQLPDEINVPSVIEIDEKQPYFVEEYISGETLVNPVKQQDQLFLALDELRPLYQQRFEGRQETTVLLERIKEKLRAKNNISSELIERSCDLLSRLEVPKSIAITQVHGDLHSENIIFDGENVYLLDWEHSSVRMAVYDFFMAFEVAFGISDDTSLFLGMVSGSGTGNKLASRYSTEFGPCVIDQTQFPTGLPIIYLLHRLTEISTETARTHAAYRLLEACITDQ